MNMVNGNYIVRTGLSVGLAIFSLFSLSAVAEPLQVPVRPGGALSGVATTDGAGLAYNPAGVSAGGRQIWSELDGRTMNLLLTSTRNDGVDPNTGEIYLPSSSEETSYGGYIGAIYASENSRFGYGLALHSTGMQSVDFRGEEIAPNYESHQRYGLIANDMRTTLLTSAVAFSLLERLHIGLGLSGGFDQIDFVQARDPLGTEGLGPAQEGQGTGLTNPYSNDALISMNGSGSHMEFSAGALWVGDRYSVGLSYWYSRPIHHIGSGTLIMPPMLGGGTIPIIGEAIIQNAPLARLGINVSPVNWLKASIDGELALWELCCSGKDGDMLMLLTDEKGDQIGPEHGVLSDVAVENYLPYRLGNRLALHGGVDILVSESVSIQAEAEWRSPSVPDYSVNAMNLDFETLSVGGGMEFTVYEGISLGFDYLEILSSTRSIDNSAWDVRVASIGDIDPDYVDERFSPQLPYTAGGNGNYESDMRTFSVRVVGNY